MKIEELGIGELIPYENNPRKNENAVEVVKASIQRFGFKVPIVIDKNNIIAAGHTRLMAAKELGLQTVPCIRANDLTDEQIRAFRLADNKAAEMADWDFDLLEKELDALSDMSMEDFGFDKEPNQEKDKEEYEKKKREFEERMAAGELSEDSDEYQEFLAKFEAKKTSDDCYTPPRVYEAVADYVAERYGKSKSAFVRPFFPGGDYQSFDYTKGCVVVDNPPFSILAEILQFYKQKRISFFLFAPALTLFSSSSSSSSTAIPLNVAVVYENGAVVATSFLTNLEDEKIRFRSDPDLYKRIQEAVKETLKENKKEIPKYSYDLHVCTASSIAQYSKYGIEFSVPVAESFPISALDAQKKSGKAIFGKGYLVSERIKAEREKAEREKAEREKAERWELSDRELQIVNELGK